MLLSSLVFLKWTLFTYQGPLQHESCVNCHSCPFNKFITKAILLIWDQVIKKLMHFWINIFLMRRRLKWFQPWMRHLTGVTIPTPPLPLHVCKNVPPHFSGLLVIISTSLVQFHTNGCRAFSKSLCRLFPSCRQCSRSLRMTPSNKQRTLISSRLVEPWSSPMYVPLRQS